VTENAAQIEAWNGAVGARWVRDQEIYDDLYGAHCSVALAGARLAAGDSVLDIGCGCGATSLQAAERTGSGGLVVGVDISAPMIARARARARDAGLPRMRFDVADVQTAALGMARFDAAISRFGVMFFDDPVRAFSNVRAALRGGGRLSFVCWRSTEENPWISVPERAAAPLVPIATPSGAGPGPFSFADAARVQGILDSAGFARVVMAPFDVELTFRGTLRACAPFIAQFGALGRALASADEPTRARAVTAVEDALRPYARREGLVMPSAAWVVTAVRA
jgi:SAM-dependent methyltransferase